MRLLKTKKNLTPSEKVSYVLLKKKLKHFLVKALKIILSKSYDLHNHAITKKKYALYIFIWIFNIQ